jgi:hypothetical protein
MARQLLRVECDAHRHALHDLDPVAGRVLRRHGGKRAAGTGFLAGHAAVKHDVGAVHVRRHGHRLADAHVLQLRLFQVGRDPHLVERNDRHQRRALRHALADLHIAPGDDAAHRRGQRRAGQPQ